MPPGLGGGVGGGPGDGGPHQASLSATCPGGGGDGFPQRGCSAAPPPPGGAGGSEGFPEYGGGGGEARGNGQVRPAAELCGGGEPRGLRRGRPGQGGVCVGKAGRHNGCGEANWGWWWVLLNIYIFFPLKEKKKRLLVFIIRLEKGIPGVVGRGGGGETDPVWSRRRGEGSLC